LKASATGPFKTLAEDIVELPIASIHPYETIPDYRDPTDSGLPIVVRTSEGCHCIDGWHLLEEAKLAGCSSTRCHVYHIEKHSDAELAIRKVAIRTKPPGGRCSYPELVRNTCCLFSLLYNSTENPVVFFHGGDRRSPDYPRRREINIRNVLATRLGKTQTTINKYLQHGEYLNDDALQALVEAAAPKLFFEAFQVKKQVEIAALQAEQKDETAIVDAISKQVLEWLSEFLQPVPLKVSSSVCIQEPQADQSPSAVQSNPGEDHSSTPALRVPQTSSGTNGSPTIAPASANPADVAIELKRIGAALIEIADDQQRPLPQQVETIRTLILELTKLLPRLARMAAREDGGKGGDV